MTDRPIKEKTTRKAQIRDVAAAAGVSVGTVSNVLNDRGNVSAKRRALVEKAIHDLSFSGSILAKGMRGQRMPVIGLCLPNATSSNFVMMSDEIEALTAASQYEMVQVISRHNPERERSRVDRLIASRASGVMLLPSAGAEDLITRLVDQEIPTVAINHFAGTGPVDHVFVDHRAAFRQATEHLIRGGYREMIVLSQFPEFAVVRENIAGIHEAVAQSDIPVAVEVFKSSQDANVFQTALAERLRLRHPRTVIVASSGILSAWTLQLLRQLGLTCPEDIGLLCAEQPDWWAAVSPGLSCIRQPTRELARIAWDMLRERIEGRSDAPRSVRCQAEVVLAGSLRLGGT